MKYIAEYLKHPASSIRFEKEFEEEDLEETLVNLKAMHPRIEILAIKMGDMELIRHPFPIIPAE